MSAEAKLCLMCMAGAALFAFGWWLGGQISAVWPVWPYVCIFAVVITLVAWRIVRAVRAVRR